MENEKIKSLILDFVLDSIMFVIGIPMAFVLFYFQVHLAFIVIALVLAFAGGILAKRMFRE
jgi:ABC-type bacteriocin/lantibiotic exporter with double-glycine peptidase domain